RQTRSGRACPSSYRLLDRGFDLTDLHRQARAAQPQDEKDLPSADIADPISLTGRPRGPLAPSDKPSRSPPPRRNAKRARSPTGASPPRKKVGKKAVAALLRHLPPLPQARDVSQYKPVVGGSSQAKKRRSRINRAKKAARARSDVWTGPDTSRNVYKKHLREAACEPTDLDWEDMPTTSTAFTGKLEETEARLYTLDELRGEEYGFDYLDWNGVTPTGIVAPDGRVFAACIGGLGNPDYVKATESLAGILETVNKHVKFPKDARDHRRGQFGAQANGTSHGGGQTEPTNLKHTPTLDAVLAYLIALPAMIRIAHFASDAFANWAPRLFAYYSDMMEKLFESDSTLRRNFPRSVWACTTINFGPRTVTFKHRDFGNLSFGWCAITALGKFNPDLGGHLVLWDCKLIIRFPPGSTVLIPSAIINHSNTIIAEGETRYSITQYTSGSLFRWVEHGLQLDEKFYAGLSEEEQVAAQQANSERWDKGVEMFSTWEELQERGWAT
ncbi:hypothetical protein HDZ31DRAFT_50230, partial [Schizophyllum fasciatum]